MAPPMPLRARLLAALALRVQDELDAVERVARQARDEATHEQTRKEGKYDTRATEASYLARGQAERVVALRALLSWLQEQAEQAGPPTAAVGALVRLAGPNPGWVLLGPTGGATARVDGLPVRLISPDAPLGEALLGARPGEIVAVEGPRGTTRHPVEELC